MYRKRKEIKIIDKDDGGNVKKLVGLWEIFLFFFF